MIQAVKCAILDAAEGHPYGIVIGEQDFGRIVWEGCGIGVGRGDVHAALRELVEEGYAEDQGRTWAHGRYWWRWAVVGRSVVADAQLAGLPLFAPGAGRVDGVGE
jgi:hypothetical protein